MLQIDMTARVRKTTGKGAARTMRRNGTTPAVIYGPHGTHVTLECNTKELTQGLLSIHRRNAYINLEIDEDGKKTLRHVMTKEIQTEPIHNALLHADFYEIALDKPLVFQVPLVYVGKAKGVDMGGDMTVVKHKVALKGTVTDMPDSLEIDVTPLGPGAKYVCGELVLPAGITLVDGADTLCVSVSGTAE